ncbi:putative glycosyltransferase family 32 protein [Phaeoacremonium minimum UCRPA7]|uniref:Putative glycosyltransferase family 32 protein n=1 Tax=Phaeoacremonium minimum (strain UCR-PA7) TaxID=1286976 RepID=R8BKU8_PHAM7|nr:putative glycosyltransferase family 32 protein [Phaeoacremonium minimum UCRPA7]EON99936.1 putative glycosyltransferase family 32 protein [Phaeoacremonium minimum UCRPA7]
MSSPLSPLSPRSLPSTPGLAKFRNRVPTQVRRGVPLYLGFICVLFIILNADLFSAISIPKHRVFSKRHVQQRPLTARPGGFPKKIWQTWKIDPLQFDERDSTTAKTWTQKNPDFRYEVLTDSNDLNYVEEHFGPSGFNRMDIVDMYRTINATIIKADLLRYMIMYAEGGVYADIDVEALKPVGRFIPDHRYAEEDVDMVIGVEIDQPEFKDHPILGKKSQSFCQWTFMCRPKLPVMMRLIENIMSWLEGMAREQNVPISEVVLDFDAVISGTGPSAFTGAVLEEMNENRPRGTPQITWDNFHELDESKVISRILVLDVEAFAAGQGHSDSGNHNARGALVKHHYHASNWPSRHPRFNHPVYGPVEHCNWNFDCVRKWDEDTAAFELLNDDEKQQKIAERQAQMQLMH